MKQLTYARTAALVMALALALVLAACPTDTGKESSGTKGLTITGIPAKFNNKYIMCMAKDFGQTYNLYGAEEFDEKTETVTLSQISAGTAKNLKVWKETNEVGEIYSGSDQGVPFTFIIFPNRTMTSNDIDNFSVLMSLMMQGGAGKATVDFTNGTGTGKFTEVSVSDLISF